MSMGTSPQKRRPDWAALFIALGLAVIAAILIWDASRLNEMSGYSPIGPATTPKIVAAGLIILAIWTVFEAFRGEFPVREKQELGPVFWVIGGLAIQMLLLNIAGFSIATGLLFAFTARAFGKRELWFSIPIGITIAFAVWLVFSQVLQLSLPAGPLENLFV